MESPPAGAYGGVSGTYNNLQPDSGVDGEIEEKIKTRQKEQDLLSDDSAINSIQASAAVREEDSVTKVSQLMAVTLCYE